MQQQKREVSNNSSNHSSSRLTAAHQQKLKEYESEVRCEHESALKRSIGQLQAELVQEQRCLKRQSQKRKQDREQLQEREVEALMRRRDGIDSEVVALGTQREELTTQLRIQTAELQEMQQTLAAQRRRRTEKRLELQQLEEAATNVKMRYEQQKDELHAQHMSRISELQRELHNAKQLRTQMSRAADDSLAALETSHDDRLDALNQQARSDIAKKDGDINLLRDAIQTEKVKLQRLRKVMARYNS